MIQQQRNSSTLLNLGVATSGELELSGDEHFFRINVTKGQKYTVSLNNLDDVDIPRKLSYEEALVINVKDINGLIVDKTNAWAREENTTTFEAGATGAHYFEVTNIDKTVPDGNTYTIKVDESHASDDHSDSSNNSATLLNLGIATSGEIELNGDQDVFRIDLTAGQQYTFSVNNLHDPFWVTVAYAKIGSWRPISEKAAIYVKDFNGQTVASIFTKAAGTEANPSLLRDPPAVEDTRTFEASVTGAHYFEVMNTANMGNRRGLDGNTYTIQVDENRVSDDHSNHSNDSATLLNLGVATSGELELYGDVDVFRIDVTEGQKYTATLNNLDDVGAPFDAIYLEIKEVYGNRSIYTYSSNGEINKITFEADATETRYFPITNSNAEGPDENTYTIQFDYAVHVSDDHSNHSNDSATLLNLGIATSGEIERTGDSDIFRIDFTAGQKYTLFLDNSYDEGILSEAATGVNDSIRIVGKDFNGRDVTIVGNNTFTPSNGEKNTVTFVASVTGTHYFDVKDWRGPDGNTYAIKVDESHASDDHSDSSNNSATLLNLGITTSGEIELNGDDDVFRINLTEGQKYTLRLNNLDDSATMSSPDAPNSGIQLTRSGVWQPYFESVILGVEDFNGRIVESLSPILTPGFVDAIDPSGGEINTTTFEASVTGTHYFEVSNFFTAGPYGNTYTINVDDVNRNPTVKRFSDAILVEDIAYSYDTSSSFSDADGDTLSYTAKLSNGNGLPSWLSISSTGTLSGTPANADLGAIEVTVTATDSSAAAASDTFTLTVTDLSPITLSTYAESTSSNFIYHSYKDLMGSDIDTELWVSWTGKLNSGEADKPSYLRMLGELPGDKQALINIDVEGSVGKDSFDSQFEDGVTESFDGGSGIDTVTFDTAKSVILKTASGFNVGGDTLTNIERLKFTDEDIALDIDGANSAGGIYRTYKAAFNRTPEETGFGYWIDRADKGASAVQMAEAFVWSAEFQTLYGVTTSDNYLVGNDIEAVVDLFYQNVLGRAPDQGGLDYYASAIVAQDKTGGQVLAEIADSAENRTNLLPTIENGMSYDLWVG